MSGTTKVIVDFLKLISTSGRKGYDRWFPDKVKVVSGGDGSCVCELTVDEDLVNVSNNLHGGCTASIVDMVSTLALMSAPSMPFPGVSVDLSVSYMAAAKLGEDIIINAKTIKAGKTLAFLTVDITRKRDGTVLATGKHTKYIGQPIKSSNL